MSSFHSEHMDDDYSGSYDNAKPASKQTYGEDEEQSQRQQTNEE